MAVFEYTIKDELGLHARPAAELVKEAKKYNAVIKAKKGEKEVRVTQLLAIMGLGIKKGETIKIIIEGEEEAAALAAMKAFFETKL